MKSVRLLLTLSLLAITTFASARIAFADHPEISIAMTFTPQRIEVNAEVTFTIRVYYTSSGLPVRGATVPVGFERGSRPMSSMQMLGGMVRAREVEPRVYELKYSFPEAGQFIVHIHVIPNDGSMMDMMRNHADFGPISVEVEGGSLPISALGLWGGVGLLSSALPCSASIMLAAQDG